MNEEGEVDVGRSSGCGAVQMMKLVALRRRPCGGEASSHLKLRWLKTVVVSVEEKAHMMRQVGIL